MLYTHSDLDSIRIENAVHETNNGKTNTKFYKIILLHPFVHVRTAHTQTHIVHTDTQKK